MGVILTELGVVQMEVSVCVVLTEAVVVPREVDVVCGSRCDLACGVRVVEK
jgi:hypothetical protein